MDAARAAAVAARPRRHQGPDRLGLGAGTQRGRRAGFDRGLHPPPAAQARELRPRHPHRARPGLPARSGRRRHVSPAAASVPARWFARGAGRSLQRQLFLWLLLPQVVLWLAAAFFTYNLAARYANQAIDASLSQASRALARQVKPTASGLYIDFPRSAQEILESDPSDRVLYTVSSPPGLFILGNPNLPPPAIAHPQIGETYFYDTTYTEPPRSELAPSTELDRARAAAGPRSAEAPPPTERVRVVALYLRIGDEGTRSGTMLVQVARSRANREMLARRILIDTVLPLSALMAAMTVIVWGGIRAGLAPLALLQRQVEGRAANDLATIEVEAAPPEVRSLARAINTLLGEVQRSVVAQKRFISDAAHQLRTPLAGLKSQTELALRDAAEPELRARLQRVHDSASRSAHLVNQLLTLARAEPESAMLQDRRAVDLARLAREVTAELVPRAIAAGIDLGCDEAAEGTEGAAAAPVRGIALLLREALVNLIDNAIRYAGRGASVTVRVRAAGDEVVVEVEDDGPGLPADEREHVFERFVRATDAGNGCGLGLAIVREIVERHAGRVTLEAAQPRGLLARVRLPTTAG
ncbi:MAG: sensor histidine kinase [Burkholderiales bacterium]|nr:sensor histidine kinase [Burkholderiales bacterium]